MEDPYFGILEVPVAPLCRCEGLRGKGKAANHLCRWNEEEERREVTENLQLKMKEKKFTSVFSRRTSRDKAVSRR